LPSACGADFFARYAAEGLFKLWRFALDVLSQGLVDERFIPGFPARRASLFEKMIDNATTRRMVMRVLPSGSGAGRTMRPRLPWLKSWLCFMVSTKRTPPSFEKGAQKNSRFFDSAGIRSAQDDNSVE
jgi:hypothetical protein